MPQLYSPYWEISMGICTKHVNQLPCNECLDAQDKGISITLTFQDVETLKYNCNLSLKDLFPLQYCGWMYPRMIN